MSHSRPKKSFFGWARSRSEKWFFGWLFTHLAIYSVYMLGGGTTEVFQRSDWNKVSVTVGIWLVIWHSSEVVIGYRRAKKAEREKQKRRQLEDWYSDELCHLGVDEWTIKIDDAYERYKASYDLK